MHKIIFNAWRGFIYSERKYLNGFAIKKLISERKRFRTFPYTKIWESSLSPKRPNLLNVI